MAPIQRQEAIGSAIGTCRPRPKGGFSPNWVRAAGSWPTAGWTVLGLLAVWRVYRASRWISRFGLRRGAWKMVNMLTDAYAALSQRHIRSIRDVRWKFLGCSQ
jgi:hypothetical protein